MTALEAVQTMQIAIAIYAFVALDFWLPALFRVVVDFRHGREQALLVVPLWRMLIGNLGAVAGAIIGFSPYIIMNVVVTFAPDSGDRPLWPTAAEQAMFFLLLLWFASWGKAAAAAIKMRSPDPWHSDEFLDWPFVLWTGAATLAISLVLVKFA